MANKYIAIIDTETTFENKLMSIGLVIANAYTYEPLDYYYYIISSRCFDDAMYSEQLYVADLEAKPMIDNTSVVMDHLRCMLAQYNIKEIYAYNATFDYKLLPMLNDLRWFDIMKIAAYKQYNKYITDDMVTCKSGRLKTNYGVEDLTRLMTGDYSYREVHNALKDAIDELRLMKLLDLHIDTYLDAKVN